MAITSELMGVKPAPPMEPRGERRTVNVLGTTYEIFTCVPEEAMAENADGCMDPTTKIIKIAEFEVDRNSVQNIEDYTRKVMRHEIVHAFLYESGLCNCCSPSESWAFDEAIVDWIALQAPKMMNAFIEAGCL